MEPFCRCSLHDCGLAQQMREKLAELMHEMWSDWMCHLFSRGTFNEGDTWEDRTWTMPSWAVQHWTRQMNTPYSELSEEEKDSDRKEAEEIFECVKTAFAAQFAETPLTLRSCGEKEAPK